MVRILLDDEPRTLVDLPKVVSRIEEGYRADGEGDVVPLPRTRTDTRGTTLAWMGAAVPKAGVLAFRSYLCGSDGHDRGRQIVALYGHEEMELRADDRHQRAQRKQSPFDRDRGEKGGTNPSKVRDISDGLRAGVRRLVGDRTVRHWRSP